MENDSNIWGFKAFHENGYKIIHLQFIQKNLIADRSILNQLLGLHKVFGELLGAATFQLIFKKEDESNLLVPK